MTKDELFKIVENYGGACDYVEDFLIDRYFGLDQDLKHWFKKGSMNEPYFDFNGGVAHISYWEEYRGCGENNGFKLPIDYLFMTDEEITKDLNHIKELKKGH